MDLRAAGVPTQRSPYLHYRQVRPALRLGYHKFRGAAPRLTA